MSGKKTVLILVCLLVGALALFAVGCGGGDADTTTTAAEGGTATTAAGGTENTAGATPSGDPLIIGAAVGLTGDAASGDVPLSSAMEFAVEELNKAGGIAGHPVKLIIKDTKSDPALGATVANELLQEGAQIMVGPPFPGMAVGVIQAAATKNVAVLGGVSTQPEYVKVGGAKAYLVAFGDNVQAAAMAEYALKLGYKTVYTLASPDLSYTAKLPVFFNDVFAKGGGSEIGTDTFSVGQQDFSAQVTKIAGLNPKPDCIYTGMFTPDVGIFLKQLRAAGVTTPVLGSDGDDQQALIDFAGKDAEGLAFTTHGFASPGSDLEKMVAAYTAWNDGKAPEANAFAGLGGDCIAIIKAAVEAAGSIDPKAIGDALANLENLRVVTGTITYKGTDGVPLKTVTIAAVEDGKFVLKEQFVPKYIPAQ
jgi:branched-chain amino acid transport system substrate-binding protein